MKKIGFIDYFMDNYHARNYPEWIEKYSNGRLKVTSAYALDDSVEGMKNAEWSEKYGIMLLPTIEATIEQSDCIMVLSPSNPEKHEELSKLALESGKRVYIDKAFASDLNTAKRMFDLAEKFGTPCCSSSALAFVYAYKTIERERICTLSSKGGGSFEVYAIHQFEPIVDIMGGKPIRIMCIGNEKFPSFIIEFDDNRVAKTEQFSVAPFEIYAGYTDGTSVTVRAEDDIFKEFIIQVIEFFETGKLVAEKTQTLAVIALIDAARKAILKPFSWVELEKY